MKRRNFLKSSLAGLSMMGMPQIGLKAADPNFSGYKALVCIFLHGGNDAWNTFVPASGSGNSQWTVYNNGRGDLSVANSNKTLPSIGTLNQGSGNPYYDSGSDSAAYLGGSYPLTSISEVKVNAMMPELARLLEDGKASLVGNIGTLVEPLSGKTDFKNRAKKRPSGLFSHNAQRRIIQTGRSDRYKGTGWAGRLGDLWSGINNDSVMGLNVSFKGGVRLMTGLKSRPVLFNPGSVITSYMDMIKGDGDDASSRRDLFSTLYGSNSESSHFRRVYNQSLKESLDLGDLLQTYWNSDHKKTFSSTASYGESLFSIPTQTQTGMDAKLKGNLIEQLEAVAQLIHLGSSSSKMNFNRQIFFVNLGDFDTHGHQLEEHPVLLRELSIAMWKFQRALEEMGVDDKVATFTQSDFGRTLGNNGDGTDHAWSTINMVMSKSSGTTFNGGKFYGNLPDFTLGGPDTVGNGTRGRFVPKLAMEQMNASLCSWFGVPDNDMETLFPNLSNFKSGTDINSAYLKLSNTKLI